MDVASQIILVLVLGVIAAWLLIRSLRRSGLW
jgi:hypothetical protein